MVYDHWIGSHDGVVLEALVQLGELRRGYYVSCVVQSSKVSNTLAGAHYGIEGDTLFSSGASLAGPPRSLRSTFHGKKNL